MKYSIRKDETPQKTVERIKKILDKNGVEINVFPTGKGKYHYSHRVQIKGLVNDVGSNGKGTCEINSLASGHAEFIERLQAQMLFTFLGDKYCFDADEKIVHFSKLADDPIIEHLKEFDISFDEFDSAFRLSKSARSMELLNKKLDKGNLFVVPYVSYKDKKIKYVSFSLIKYLQGSNGLASGNTYEEASIQALSEVVERYCAKEILKNKISMPIIPRKYYEKYENILGLIEEVEKYGYKITLRDASLGKGFPVLCVVAQDIKNKKNGVTLRFGAHPYFPIALERTMTEFLQGCDAFEKIIRVKAKYHHNINSSTKEKIVAEQFIKKIFYKRTNKCIEKILSDDFDYQFDEKIWLFDEDVDNKTLFNNLAKLVIKYSGDIYIRNYSFMGFPAVSIYAKEFSNGVIIKKGYFKVLKDFSMWKKFADGEEIEDCTIENLFEVCKVMAFQEAQSDYPFDWTEYFYMGFYCAMVLKNRKYIRKFLNVIIGLQCASSVPKEKNAILRIYQALNKYFKLYFLHVDENKIKEIIEKQYSPFIYSEIKNKIDNTNFETIKEMLRSDEFKSINLEENKEEKLEELKKKLHKIAYKHKPNQNKILKIIDGYKPTLGEKIKNLFIS